MCKTRGCTTGVGCESLNKTRFDWLNRSPPDQHQMHVQKFRPLIVLSEIGCSRCHRDFGDRGLCGDALGRSDLHLTGEINGKHGCVM